MWKLWMSHISTNGKYDLTHTGQMVDKKSKKNQTKKPQTCYSLGCCLTSWADVDHHYLTCAAWQAAAAVDLLLNAVPTNVVVVPTNAFAVQQAVVVE